jgi:hypothetical protein
MQVAEVRAALAAMKGEQRRLTIIKNLGDPLVAAAALRGPAFLAGLDPGEQSFSCSRCWTGSCRGGQSPPS